MHWMAWFPPGGMAKGARKEEALNLCRHREALFRVILSPKKSA